MLRMKDRNILSWKLERKNIFGDWMTADFYVKEFSGSFYFIIKPIEEKPDFGTLWLSNQSYGLQEVFGSINLDLVLKYDSETKEITFSNLKYIPDGDCFHQIVKLGEIKTKKLLEITCSFFKTQPSKSINRTTGAESADEPIQEDIHCDTNKKENENTKEQSLKVKNYVEITPKEAGNVAARHRGEIVLIEDIKNLFLDEEKSDILLKVEDQTYPAHELIIGARSPVFYAMLKHDMKEKQEGAIIIEDCDSHVFREFLFYLYSGKLDNLTDDNVFELHHISDKYDVRELRMDCIDFIRNHLKIETVCDTITLASKHCENDLLTLAIEFFIDNVHDIITTVKWQKFLKENPTEANELFLKTINKKIPKNINLE